MKPLIPILMLAGLLFGCKKDSESPTPANPVIYKNTKASISNPHGVQVDRIAPASNQFTVDGSVHYVQYLGERNDQFPSLWFQSGEKRGIVLTCSTKDVFPVADGEYAYKLDNDLSEPNRMQVFLRFLVDYREYELYEESGSYAVLKIVAGKKSLVIPRIRLDAVDGSGNSVMLSATLSQSQMPADRAQVIKPFAAQ